METDKKNGILFIGMLLTLIIVIVALVLIFGKSSNKTTTSNSASTNTSCDSITYTKPATDPVARLSTTKGCLVLELYQKDAPKTVQNFIKHSQDGYYNNTVFHRTLKDFVIQGGDPKGDGTGGESIYGTKFEDELNKDTQSYKTGYIKGVLAMANSGPNTNGSQFFITVGDLSSSLQKNYTIFGKVLAGQDSADAIANAETVDNGQGEKSKPVTAVSISKIDIIK